jgi:two-component system, NarL family, sensor kinase
MPEKLSESEVLLMLIASTLVTLILAVLIVIAVYIGQRRKFRHRKELIEMKNNYDKEVLRTQLETQTQTFETISRELHDNVGTLISIAMVHLKSPSDNSNRKEVSDAHTLLDEAMDILRDISRSINPENIQRRGLAQAVRHELDRLRRSKIFKVQYTSEGIEFPIDPQQQIILFRIVQETLNNVIKHSGGNEVKVSVAFAEPTVVITVEDNGKGFVHMPRQGDLLNHSGLANMKKRATMVGANLHINSVLGKGTLVQVEYRHTNGQP